MENITWFGNFTNEQTEKIKEYVSENYSTNTDVMVMTEQAREKEAKDCIRESLWAFNSSFIVNHIKESVVKEMSDYEYDKLESVISNITGDMCESANGLIFALIEDFDEFFEEAISCDGYGHFLNKYDGTEDEVDVDGEWFFIYRD